MANINIFLEARHLYFAPETCAISLTLDLFTLLIRYRLIWGISLQRDKATAFDSVFPKPRPKSRVGSCFVAVPALAQEDVRLPIVCLVRCAKQFVFGLLTLNHHLTLWRIGPHNSQHNHINILDLGPQRLCSAQGPVNHWPICVEKPTRTSRDFVELSTIYNKHTLQHDAPDHLPPTSPTTISISPPALNSAIIRPFHPDSDIPTSAAPPSPSETQHRPCYPQ